jgi:hypothetical protein
MCLIEVTNYVGDRRYRCGGTQSDNRLARVILGSVADELLHEIQGTVIVILGTLFGQKMGAGAEQVERSAPAVDADSQRQKEGS